MRNQSVNTLSKMLLVLTDSYLLFEKQFFSATLDPNESKYALDGEDSRIVWLRQSLEIQTLILHTFSNISAEDSPVFKFTIVHQSSFLEFLNRFMGTRISSKNDKLRLVSSEMSQTLSWLCKNILLPSSFEGQSELNAEAKRSIYDMLNSL
jgi:hypothetical protein